MSMHHDASGNSLDMIAADYVMGLLDESDREQAERRILSDAAFAAAVNAWRERLSEFDESVEPLTPSAALWDRIAATTRKEPISALPGARNAVRGATLWNNLGFWRVTGLTASAAAMLFAVVALGALTTSKELRRDLVALAQRKPVFVAVLVNDTTKEAGAIVNTFANGRVEMIPLKDIEVPAGRTLQVWTLWDRAIGPKSIGITGESKTIQLNLDQLPETVVDQLFEITLEPAGGSPIGRPTGPILYKGTTARAL